MKKVLSPEQKKVLFDNLVLILETEKWNNSFSVTFSGIEIYKSPKYFDYYNRKDLIQLRQAINSKWNTDLNDFYNWFILQIENNNLTDSSTFGSLYRHMKNFIEIETE